MQFVVVVSIMGDSGESGDAYGPFLSREAAQEWLERYGEELDGFIGGQVEQLLQSVYSIPSK